MMIVTGAPTQIFRLVPTGDQTTTINTSTAITGLSFAAAANSMYEFNGFMRIGCNNTGGVKIDVTLPASATVGIVVNGTTTANTIAVMNAIVSSATLTTTAFCQENNANRWLRVSGTITTAGTAGTVTVGFASGTSTQTSTVFKEGSVITIVKLT